MNTALLALITIGVWEPVVWTYIQAWQYKREKKRMDEKILSFFDDEWNKDSL